MSLPLPTVPVYEVVLPVTKQKVKYRPFLVKEEKLLLLAKQQDSTDEVISAINQVMAACTFDKVNVQALPTADVEFLFVRVRERSIGEKITGEIDCKACGNKQPYGIDLQKVTVENNVKENALKLDDKTVVTMRWPTLNMARGLDKLPPAEIPLNVAASLIESITVGDQMYVANELKRQEIVEWLEHCTESQVGVIGNFLNTLPKLVYKDSVPCKKCGTAINVYTEGIDSFFN